MPYDMTIIRKIFDLIGPVEFLDGNEPTILGIEPEFLGWGTRDKAARTDWMFEADHTAAALVLDAGHRWGAARGLTFEHDPEKMLAAITAAKGEGK